MCWKFSDWANLKSGDPPTRLRPKLHISKGSKNSKKGWRSMIPPKKLKKWSYFFNYSAILHLSEICNFMLNLLGSLFTWSLKFENCQYISICNPENPSTLVVTMLHQCDTWHAHATLSHCLDTTLSVQNLKTLLMWNCMKKRNVGCQYQPWRSWLSWICTNQILVLGSRQDQVL